jgi:hypothetical protein
VLSSCAPCGPSSDAFSDAVDVRLASPLRALCPAPSRGEGRDGRGDAGRDARPGGRGAPAHHQDHPGGAQDRQELQRTLPRRGSRSGPARAHGRRTGPRGHHGRRDPGAVRGRRIRRRTQPRRCPRSSPDLRAAARVARGGRHLPARGRGPRARPRADGRAEPAPVDRAPGSVAAEPDGELRRGRQNYRFRHGARRKSQVSHGERGGVREAGVRRAGGSQRKPGGLPRRPLRARRHALGAVRGAPVPARRGERPHGGGLAQRAEPSPDRRRRRSASRARRYHRSPHRLRSRGALRTHEDRGAGSRLAARVIAAIERR